MKRKIIRTNDRCEQCDGFLIFEVRDEFYDNGNNKTRTGIWKCTICETATIGSIIRSLRLRAASEN
jgi:hypothetical protein